MIAQIVFVVISIVAFGYAVPQFMKIRRNILLGKDEITNPNMGKALQNVMLVAFGQKKMFKRWVPAVGHLFIYVAFLFTQIELVEILIDGVFGVHRFFAAYLGFFYTFLISFVEILSLLAFIATLIFLIRRNLLKVPRFHSTEMRGFPTLDGNLILYLEILLIVGLFMANGTDMVLQSRGADHYPQTGLFALSGFFGPMVFGQMADSSLIFIERVGWWLHVLVVFGFLNYLPKSKHLHIFLAFPNTYFARQKPAGTMENMPDVEKEVRSIMNPEAAFSDEEMGEELPEFGAHDIYELSWKNILDAYTCTECGRCTSVCPANITGKKLSPRKIMMDIRDRATEIGDKLDAKNEEHFKKNSNIDFAFTIENFDDGKSLFDYISREEIHACTTCNACVEACPVLINPLDAILRMRRYEILTESVGPSEWLPMFSSIENSGSVWQIPEPRDKWRTDALNNEE